MGEKLSGAVMRDCLQTSVPLTHSSGGCEVGVHSGAFGSHVASDLEGRKQLLAEETRQLIMP